MESTRRLHVEHTAAFMLTMIDALLPLRSLYISECVFCCDCVGVCVFALWFMTCPQRSFTNEPRETGKIIVWPFLIGHLTKQPLSGLH